MTPSGASALGQALIFTTKTSTAIQLRAGKPPAKVTSKVAQGHRARWSWQGRAQRSHVPRLTLSGPQHMGRGLQMDLRANSPPQPGQLRVLACLFRPGAHKGQPSTRLQKCWLLHLGHPTQPEPRDSAVTCTPRNRQNWQGQGEGSRGQDQGSLGQGEGSHGQQKAQRGRGYFPARRGPKPIPGFRLHSQRGMGWGGWDDALGRQAAAVLAGLSAALHTCFCWGCCGQLCAHSTLPLTNSAPQRGPGFLPTSRGHRKGPAGVCVHRCTTRADGSDRHLQGPQDGAQLPASPFDPWMPPTSVLLPSPSQALFWRPSTPLYSHIFLRGACCPHFCLELPGKFTTDGGQGS